MTERFVRWLFWDRPLGPRTRWLWFLVFLGAPLAYWGAYSLHSLQHHHHVRQPSREELVQQAREFVMVHGLDVREWSAKLRFDSRNDRQFDYRKLPQDTAREFSALTGQMKVVVSFISPMMADADEVEVKINVGPPPEQGGRRGPNPQNLNNAEVEFSPDGRVVDWRIPSGVSPTYVGPGELAEQDLNILREQFPSLTLGQMVENAQLENGKPVGMHMLTEGTLAGMPELKLKIEQDIRAGLLINRKISYSFPGNRDSGPTLPGISLIVGLSYFLFSALALISYARQSFHREAAHGRTLLVLLLAGAFQFIYFYGTEFSENSSMQPRGSSGQQWLIGLVLFVVSLLIGAWLGLFYGAAEAALRRQHPGILTSLDAVLSGHLICRQTGRSILIGLAVGGWLVLGNALFRLVLFPGAFNPMSESMLRLSFSTNPTLVALVSPMASIFFSVIPCVLPLVYLESWSKGRPRLAYAGTAFLMVLVHILVREDGYLGLDSISIAVWTTLLVLLVLLRVDLMASAFLLLAEGTHLMHMPLLGSGNSLVLANWITLALFVATVAYALYSSLRGPILSDEEVSPGYARVIALRDQRRDELHAARDVQKRLIPLEAPQLPGLQISSLFWPSRLVGGDFYDFFKLSETKVGILIAEGNGRGLDAAMTMAMAKGYLAERLKCKISPLQAMQNLHASAAHLFVPGEGSSIGGICYAEIDAAERTWSYARLGEWPQVSVNGAACVEETTETGGASFLTSSGSLDNGEQLDLYSDGFSRQWSLREPRKWLAEQLTPELPLEGQIANLLGRRHAGPIDDLTLIRVCGVAAKASLQKSAAEAAA